MKLHSPAELLYWPKTSLLMFVLTFSLWSFVCKSKQKITKKQALGDFSVNWKLNPNFLNFGWLMISQYKRSCSYPLIVSTSTEVWKSALVSFFACLVSRILFIVFQKSKMGTLKVYWDLITPDSIIYLKKSISAKIWISRLDFLKIGDRQEIRNWYTPT